MAVRVDRFEIGKGTSLKELNRFLLERGVRSADVLNVQVNPLGPDKTEYLVMREDSDRPRVVSTIPLDGQFGIGPGTTVLAIFSEPIQAVTSGDVEVFNVTDNVLIPAVSYTIDNSQVGESRGILRIEDSGGYQENGKIYRVTFKTTIQDLDGNTMEEPYDLIFTVSTSQATLDFDGGRVGAGSFANPTLNRWEVIVTPVRLTHTSATLLDLTFEHEDGGELAGFNLHAEKLGPSFRVVIEHDFKNQVPEPTGILPTGVQVHWKAVNGL